MLVELAKPIALCDRIHRAPSSKSVGISSEAEASVKRREGEGEGSRRGFRCGSDGVHRGAREGGGTDEDDGRTCRGPSS